MHSSSYKWENLFFNLVVCMRKSEDYIDLAIWLYVIQKRPNQFLRRLTLFTLANFNWVVSHSLKTLITFQAKVCHWQLKPRTLARRHLQLTFDPLLMKYLNHAILPKERIKRIRSSSLRGISFKKVYTECGMLCCSSLMVL